MSIVILIETSPFTHLWIGYGKKIAVSHSGVWFSLIWLFSVSSMFASLPDLETYLNLIWFDHFVVIISFLWYFIKKKTFAGDTFSESPSRTSTIFGVVGTIRLVVGRYAYMFSPWVVFIYTCICICLHINLFICLYLSMLYWLLINI